MTSPYLDLPRRPLAQAIADRAAAARGDLFTPGAWVERPVTADLVERGRVQVCVPGWALIDFGTYRSWVPAEVLRPAWEHAA